MAMKFMHKAKKFVPTQSPKYMLHKHLTGHSDGRGYKKVHASELTKSDGFCPRLYALADVAGVKVPDEWLTTSEEVTFQIGRDLQDRVAHWFADMEKAVGDWKCLACGKIHPFQPRPTKCLNCFCKGFKHEEVRFTSAENGASCGVDLLLQLGKPKLTPLEIKTIDKDQFKTLIAPMGEHKQRTKLYLRLIAESDAPNATLVETDEAIIFYVSKGGYGVSDLTLKDMGLSDKFSPFKEFTVTREDDKVDEEAKMAKVVKDFRDGLVGMPCGICATALDKRAQFCAAKKPCWSGEHPPEYDWTQE